jgi:hypothetical protein
VDQAGDRYGRWAVALWQLGPVSHAPALGGRLPGMRERAVAVGSELRAGAATGSATSGSFVATASGFVVAPRGCVAAAGGCVAMADGCVAAATLPGTAEAAA